MSEKEEKEREIDREREKEKRERERERVKVWRSESIDYNGKEVGYSTIEKKERWGNL